MYVFFTESNCITGWCLPKYNILIIHFSNINKDCYCHVSMVTTNLKTREKNSVFWKLRCVNWYTATPRRKRVTPLLCSNSPRRIGCLTITTKAAQSFARSVTLHQSSCTSTTLVLAWLSTNVKALRTFETSVNIYQSTRRYITKDLHLQQNRFENLKCLKLGTHAYKKTLVLLFALV